MLFSDRIAAGQKLASELNTYANRADVAVMGLARGGIPVAAAMADRLNISWDILIVRKLGVPDNPELAMGAIAFCDICLLNQAIVDEHDLSTATIQEVVARETAELTRREKIYFSDDYVRLDLKSSTVILVDDGLATGATMLAAIASMQQQQAKEIIVAVPIGVEEVCQRLAEVVDRVVCLAKPQPFQAVSIWYDNFPQLSDEEVISWLTQRKIKSRDVS
jgi:putative phosphoribosyl transferase